MDTLGPPVLKSNGSRRVTEHLCKAANIEINDDHGYVTPYSGRRRMCNSTGPRVRVRIWARYLDNSEEQVCQAFQYIEATDCADKPPKLSHATTNASATNRPTQQTASKTMGQRFQPLLRGDRRSCSSGRRIKRHRCIPSQRANPLPIPLNRI